jgi:hypothetical protein
MKEFPYLSKKEPFGNICGYFSAGCKMKIPKELEKKQMINLHMNQYTCCTEEIVPEPNSLPMLVQ